MRFLGDLYGCYFIFFTFFLSLKKVTGIIDASIYVLQSYLLTPPPYLFSDKFDTVLLQIHFCANLRTFFGKIILAKTLFV